MNASSNKVKWCNILNLRLMYIFIRQSAFMTAGSGKKNGADPGMNIFLWVFMYKQARRDCDTLMSLVATKIKMALFTRKVKVI